MIPRIEFGQAFYVNWVRVAGGLITSWEDNTCNIPYFVVLAFSPLF
jgi:hypothetical protein